MFLTSTPPTLIEPSSTSQNLGIKEAIVVFHDTFLMYVDKKVTKEKKNF